MTVAGVPASVWLLDGTQDTLAALPVLPQALAQAMAQRHSGVQWRWLPHPPAHGDNLADHLQTGRMQLVLLVEEQATPCMAETHWRHWLQEGGWPHAVLHLPGPAMASGQPDDALLNRLAACTGLPHSAPAQRARRAWQHWGDCEGCSDPACEQRLFQALLVSRSVQA